ncbi:LysR family transcriptional regulator [Polaromonas sp. P1-6]|nr:LysR family transcriptional regulator [Polaromonas sp. P1-6]
MLDLNDVALFVHVVRAGSFAEAARRLGMPPNTASRRVQALERHLGVRLMQRSTRKLTLTDAGRTFYGGCAEQVEALAQSAQELADGSQLPKGTVRVAAPADFFSFFLMDWIAEFLAAHPLVRIEFVLSDARADLIGEGIDVAFRTGKILEPNVVARHIGTGRATLVASSTYLAARGTPNTLQALSEHECITLVQPTGRISWRLDGPDGAEEIVVGGRFGANTVQTLLKATLAGLGIALLPAVMTAPHVRAGDLKEVLPDYGVNGIGVYFVFLSSRQLPRAVRAFIDFTMTKMLDQGLIQPAADRSVLPPG